MTALGRVVERVARSLRSAGLAPPGARKPGLVFMHVPKTGGTSVDRALRRAYGPWNSARIDTIVTVRAIQQIEAADDGTAALDKFMLRESLLLVEMTRGTRYVSGHVHFNNVLHRAFADRYAWVTVLRDPVDRYISQYLFDAHKPGEHARVTQALGDFLETPRGRRRGRSYVDYLGGFYRGDETDPREKLEVAKEHLDRLALVGFLDDVDTFGRRLGEMLEMRLKLPHLNRNPVARSDVDASVRSRVEEVCAYDVELYEYARGRFG